MCNLCSVEKSYNKKQLLRELTTYGCWSEWKNRIEMAAPVQKIKHMKTRKLTTPMLLITALLLIGGSVTAHGKINKMVATYENIDPEMKVEEWMVAESAWVKSSLSDIRLEAESLLILEPWMTNDFLWNYGSYAIDATLNLEPWMVADDRWEPEACIAKPMTDLPLTIELWMTSSDNWK